MVKLGPYSTAYDAVKGAKLDGKYTFKIFI